MPDTFSDSNHSKSHPHGKSKSWEAFLFDMEGILNGDWWRKPGESFVHVLWSHYRDVFNYFDDWVLIQANEDNTEIRDIVLRKKEGEHIETIEWGKK